MLYRRLILVALLTGCDYLLWDWSLAGNHSGEAIVSGLTLPVLLAVLAWLAVLTLARMIGSSRAKKTTGSPVTLAHHAGRGSTVLSSLAEDQPVEADAVSTTGKLAA